MTTQPEPTDNPMAAALARLRAEHPDLPSDGGRVWEPVQDDEEAQQCRTPSPDGMHTCALEPQHNGLHADKHIATLTPNGSRMVWETPVVPTPCSQPNPCEDGEPCDRHEVEQAHAEGEHEYCGVTCEVQFPSELMRNFILAKGYPGTEGMLDELLRRAAEGQPDPAEACQFHSPTGSPCECGCDAGADCHPRRTA